MSFWIDASGAETEVGEVGFLVRVTNLNTGVVHYNLTRRPAHTNMSHEPKLRGWCGSVNGRNEDAIGLAKVVRVAKNGRAVIERVSRDEYPKHLEALGYPDLDG